MSRHRYPRSALIADDLRGGAGLALTGLPLLALPLNPWAAAGFAGAALIFGLFTLRTLQRHWTEIAVDEDGIAAQGPLGAAIGWGDLTRLRLRYFSTRRDREQGWMQLTLRGGSRRLSLDSTLDGFDAVVERAVRAARARHLTIDPATRDNLLALGLDPGPETDPAAGATAAPPGGGDAGKGWFDRLRLEPAAAADTAAPDAGPQHRPSGSAGR